MGSNIVADLDMQSTSPQEINQQYTNRMKIATVSETFEEYTCLSTNMKDLPQLAPPPETARILSSNVNHDSQNLCILTAECSEIVALSDPHYSLITFHNEKANCIPTTHARIEVPSDSFDIETLRTLSYQKKLIYEIYIHSDCLAEDRKEIELLLQWLMVESLYFFVTVPLREIKRFKELFQNYSWNEIQRPFMQAPFTSSIT
jgi:hypothetical protein